MQQKDSISASEVLSAICNTLQKYDLVVPPNQKVRVFASNMVSGITSEFYTVTIYIDIDQHRQAFQLMVCADHEKSGNC